MISTTDSLSEDPRDVVRIQWTRPMLKRFKKAFAQAVIEQNTKEGVFNFDGREFLIAYAAYLIEHLDHHVFAKGKKKN